MITGAGGGLRLWRSIRSGAASATDDEWRMSEEASSAMIGRQAIFMVVVRVVGIPLCVVLLFPWMLWYVVVWCGAKL